MSLIVVLALGWAAGIWAGAQILQPWWAWLMLAGLAGGLLYLRRAEPRARWILAAGIVFGLGGMRYQLALPDLRDPAFIASHNEAGEVTLEGVVWDEPDVRDTRTNLRVRVDTLLLPDAKSAIAVHGTALVYAPRYSDVRLERTGEAEWRYGDRVRVFGRLETPPIFPDFSYKDYLARQGVYSQVRTAQVFFVGERRGPAIGQGLFAFKRQALSVLERIFPEPHASLLQGILLGVDSRIPQRLKDAFSATGTSHIVAISGFNVSLLAAIIAAFANRIFGARRGAVIAILGIAAYTVLVGASASVVRAAIMGSLALVAGRIGRRVLGLNTLAAAVIAMTLLNPLTLWDVGFQLSVMATLGLVVYAEPFEAGFNKFATRFTSPENAARLTSYAGEFFLLTLAAQVTTLPLMAYYFRQVSLISLVANVVVLPAQPALMVMAGIALILGLIWLPLGRLAAWATWPFSAYTIAFVEWFARVPGASIGLSDVAPVVAVGLYGVLFGLTWILNRPAEQRPDWWGSFVSNWLPVAGLAGLGLATVLVWGLYFSLPDGRLRVTVLDVGPGDAILIQTPSGANVLIDGGPSGGALARALASELPLFTTRLDLLVIANPQDSSIAGLPDALARYSVSRTVVTSAAGKSAAYQALMESLNDKEIEIVSAAGLPVFDLGDGITLRVLSDGVKGSALRLEYGRASVVLPLGSTAADLSDMLMHGRAAPASVLVLGDPAVGAALTPDWVSAINPRITLMAVGAENSQGDSFRALLQLLSGYAVMNTAQSSSLTLLTDGAQLWVETAR